MTIYFMIFYGLLSSFYFYPRKELEPKTNIEL